MSQEQNYDSSRRGFFKNVGKLAYVAPVILSLKAIPSFAGTGSICDQFTGQERATCENLFGQGGGNGGGGNPNP
jgi:hypothetical protein